MSPNRAGQRRPVGRRRRRGLPAGGARARREHGRSVRPAALPPPGPGRAEPARPQGADRRGLLPAQPRRGTCPRRAAGTGDPGGRRSHGRRDRHRRHAVPRRLAARWSWPGRAPTSSCCCTPSCTLRRDERRPTARRLQRRARRSTAPPSRRSCGSRWPAAPRPPADELQSGILAALHRGPYRRRTTGSRCATRCSRPRTTLAWWGRQRPRRVGSVPALAGR